MLRVSLILPVESICLLSSDDRVLRADTQDADIQARAPIGR
jgi:hypothetical protein